MIAIKEIVQQALDTGYLSVMAQDQIHKLLQTNYDSEDLDALIILHRSIADNEVKQETINQKNYCFVKDKDASSNIKLAYQIAAEMAFAAALALSMPYNTN
ncbi:hypothetical protein A0J48_022065 [Sphaerospermopsis aphanizomenoides BCCUSP55]|uniref:hypothetical protein n=1 Tax=Sphaerospermopsis aphanizomenoides TaxID=459663 RepID=UPI000B2DFEE5|nr:hypothetical protein [Sphaerospermopsis aphanizomenoides]MBK1990178.1 hypothetical protein [Sphaerospermopsis aphanizomenoides BCCUSP55]